MNEFAIQFNVNSYGLLPTVLNIGDLQSGKSTITNVQLVKGGNVGQMEPENLLQVAIKNNNGVYYFSTLLPSYIN